MNENIQSGIKIDRRNKDIKLLEDATGKRVAYAKDFIEENNVLRRHYYTDKDEDLGLIESYQVSDDGSKNKFAIGVVIPKRSPTPMKFLQESREYNDTNSGIHEQIRLSNNMYLWEGIVGTSIDVLVDFAVTDGYWENVNSDIAKRILQYWSENVNNQNYNMSRGIKELAKEIVLEWFLAGNSLPYSVWKDTKEAKLRLRRSNVSLPMDIFLINPLAVKIPEESISFGMKEIYLNLNYGQNNLLNLNRMSEENTKKLQEYLKKINALTPKQKTKDGYLLLDNKYVYHIKRKGRGYHAWGTPYLTRAFSAFASKKKIKALDDSTTEGLINMVTIFKVGDPDNPKTWNPARIRAFANLLKSATASNYLVWSYDVETEQIGPKDEVLGFDDKYKQVNTEIKEALGLPAGLTIGSADSEKTVWITILSLIERLQDIRDKLIVYFEDQGRKVMVENGFEDEYPKYIWANTKLRNEEKVKDLVMKLYDRGILSIKTSIQEAGYDFEKEKGYREQEVREALEKIFSVRQLPFSSPNLGKDADDGEGGEEKDKNSGKKKKTKVKVEVEKSGRPEGSKKD